MHLNFLSAPIMPISMFFPEICPSNLGNTHKRKQKRKFEKHFKRRNKYHMGSKNTVADEDKIQLHKNCQ